MSIGINLNFTIPVPDQIPNRLSSCFCNSRFRDISRETSRHLKALTYPQASFRVNVKIHEQSINGKTVLSDVPRIRIARLLLLLPFLIGILYSSSLVTMPSAANQPPLAGGVSILPIQSPSKQPSCNAAKVTMEESGKEDAARIKVVEHVLSTQYVDGIWKLARKVLDKTDNPDMFPRYTIPGLPYYAYHDSSFWTSGFFPGSVWTLYERSLKRPHLVPLPSPTLLTAAKKWQAELAKEQFKTDNHDLGFMVMPSFKRDFELTGCRESLEVVINAARSVATRYNSTTRVIRSWAGARTKEYDLNQKDIDYIVVMDGMMNLDLLYYAAKHTGEIRLADIATAHAETTLKNHLRPDWSSYHVVNYDVRDGSVRNRLTSQGYDHESTWARGQAWALYGFASVYEWTREERFLQASMHLIDYFLSRVDEQENIVYWDFDAPRPGVWDVSAATIACSGILLLLQQAKLDLDALDAGKYASYLDRVMQILNVVVEQATDPDSDALFDKSTSNDHRHAMQRTAHHGSSYADYYFLECGNRLIDLGYDR